MQKVWYITTKDSDKPEIVYLKKNWNLMQKRIINTQAREHIYRMLTSNKIVSELKQNINN